MLELGWAVSLGYASGHKRVMQAVVETLTDHGVESETVEEDGYVLVHVPCSEDDDRNCQELIVDIDAWLTERGLPFVPEEVDGRILIRPPAS